jgi:hypothetical protein
VGAAATALAAERWPPCWPGLCSAWVRLVPITLAWALVLTYLRWQLLRRRWAAVQIAGLEQVLARWMRAPPERLDLLRDTQSLPPPSGAPELVRRILSFFWPCQGPRLGWDVEADVCENAYPAALQEEWQGQRKAGTGAIEHERLVFLTGVLFYAALVLRTLGPSRPWYVDLLAAVVAVLAAGMLALVMSWVFKK